MRAGVLSAEATPYWLCRRLHGDRRRFHILGVLRRSVTAGSPSRHLPLSRLRLHSAAGAAFRQVHARRYDTTYTRPYGVYLFSFLARAESEPPPVPVHCLSSYRGFLSGFSVCAPLLSIITRVAPHCARLFSFSLARSRSTVVAHFSRSRHRRDLRGDPRPARARRAPRLPYSVSRGAWEAGR